MSFERPEMPWVALGAVIVLTLVFAFDATWRRRKLARLGNSVVLDRMMASLSRRRRVARAILFVMAVVLCLLAAGKPTVPGESTWRLRGIDIALVFDFSKSMLARDVYPNRLERAKREAESLMGDLEADRISPVIFAGAAIHFPLTHDHQAARLLYGSSGPDNRGIAPSDLAPGSNLGEGIMVARCVLRPDVLDDSACARIGGRGRGGDPLGSEEDESLRAALTAETPQVEDRARAIVIFTDGEDTEGRARSELEEAVRLGIQVYVIGVGTTKGEGIPEYDDEGNQTGWKQGSDGSPVWSRLDQAGLKELAELAGGDGHYYWLGPKGFDRARLLEQLKGLKSGVLDERMVRRPRHIYQRFLFPAFLLLIIEACMGDRRRRVSTLGGESVK